MCKASGEVVVLKVYTLAAVCDLYKFQIYREVHLHSGLQHENIVSHEHSCATLWITIFSHPLSRHVSPSLQVTMHAAFQEGDKVVMVQEFADGADLFTVLHKYGGRMSERLAVQMVLEPFMRVLSYLHARGIIHRDIKVR